MTRILRGWIYFLYKTSVSFLSTCIFIYFSFQIKNCIKSNYFDLFILFMTILNSLEWNIVLNVVTDISFLVSERIGIWMCELYGMNFTSFFYLYMFGTDKTR